MIKLIRAFHAFSISDTFFHIVMVLVAVYLSVAMFVVVVS